MTTRNGIGVRVERLRETGALVEVRNGDLVLEDIPPEKISDARYLREHEQQTIGYLEDRADPPPGTGTGGCRQSAARMARFQPFPIDALPGRLATFTDAASKAMGCDTAYVALPLLATLASAVGNSRAVMLKRGWTAPAILWTVCVGESGSGKSPPLKLVLKPVRAAQRRAMRQMEEAEAEYEQAKLAYEGAVAKWKRKPEGEPPTKPEPPRTPRMVVSDATVEAMAAVLADNPRGVLNAWDELSGWLGGFDRYATGNGSSDASAWLSMHDGETLIVDRKTGQRVTIVPLASVSITGGIQPAILARALRGQLRENGLAARLLMAFPPQRPKRWKDEDLPPEHLATLEAVFENLRTLLPDVDENGDAEPVLLRLSADARSRFIEYVNEHGAEQAELSGDLAAVWSKLEESAARIGLILHLARWALGDIDDTGYLDEWSMTSGIRLARWFGAEAKRIYAVLDETDDDRDQRRLIEWIERKGRSVTVRDAQQGRRQYRTAKDAEAALQELVNAGFGQWHDAPPDPKGGRPSRIFVLSTVSTSTQPPESRVLEGFVDVDSVDTPKTQPSG